MVFMMSEAAGAGATPNLAELPTSKFDIPTNLRFPWKVRCLALSSILKCWRKRHWLWSETGVDAWAVCVQETGTHRGACLRVAKLLSNASLLPSERRWESKIPNELQKKTSMQGVVFERRAPRWASRGSHSCLLLLCTFPICNHQPRLWTFVYL